MPTYADIISWVKVNKNFSAQPCWIAECKAEVLKLPDPDKNRDGTPRKKQMKQPMSVDKRAAIKAAFDAIGVPDGKRLK